jgi:hypothetical protein
VLAFMAMVSGVSARESAEEERMDWERVHACLRRTNLGGGTD